MNFHGVQPVCRPVLYSSTKTSSCSCEVSSASDLYYACCVHVVDRDVAMRHSHHNVTKEGRHELHDAVSDLGEVSLANGINVATVLSPQ